MKRVLITGGTGFIGRHTLDPLIERGYEVHILTSRPKDLVVVIGSSQIYAQKNVIIHHGNLLDCSIHKHLISRIRPSHLLHTAWYTQNGKFWDAVENIYWLKATLSLFEIFYAEGGNRALGLGTCAEYDWAYGLCVESETPEVPVSLYGKTKKSTFDCLTALAKSQSSSLAWARIFFPYGPGEAEARLIPYVITKLVRGEAAHCTHGNQIRDFLHVIDMGQALAAVLDSDITGAINIGSGIPMTIRQLVSHIGLILGRTDLLTFGSIPEPTHSPRMILANIDRLKKEVNWMPSLSIDEGILNTIDWWRNLESMNLISGEA